MAIDRQGTALALLRNCIGVFFVFEGIGKIPWLSNPSILAGQLAAWTQQVPAGSWSHLYLERVALLRLADAEVLPFDYETYGTPILEYIGEIEQTAAKASPDGAKKVDFAGLRAAAEGFAKAGADVRARSESMLASSAASADLAAINRRLIMAERDLIEPAGLPDRPWYRHVVYAPGLYTGYGVKTIPGVREAVDAGNYTRAAEQASIVIRARQRATRTLWP